MGDKMNLDVYSEKLKNSGLRGATEYKNKFIPNVLYKYNSGSESILWTKF